jgi:NADH:ubiquinone oxidoreductase subunit E
MNERIEQFALQATDTIEIFNPDTGITHKREFFDKEKFAQLIVRECANVGCETHGNYDVHDDILKHFGLEEIE